MLLPRRLKSWTKLEKVISRALENCLQIIRSNERSISRDSFWAFRGIQTRGLFSCWVMTKTFWITWGINYCCQTKDSAGLKDRLGGNQGMSWDRVLPCSLGKLIAKRGFFCLGSFSASFPVWLGNPLMQSLCISVPLSLPTPGLTEVQRMVVLWMLWKLIGKESTVSGIKVFEQSAMGSQSLCPLYINKVDGQSLSKSWGILTLRHTSGCGDGQEMEAIPILWVLSMPTVSQD